MGLRELKVLILGDATGAEEAFGKLKESSGSAAEVGKGALMGLGVVVAAVGAFALDMADKYEASHARLTTALADTGQSWDQVSAQVKNTDSAMEKLGFTNAQTEDAMSRLELATKNTAQSQRDLAIAADLARARGMDLSDAAQLVAKVSGGTYTALTRLGLASKDTVKGFQDSGQALDYLAKSLGGQASAYADTFSGKMDVLKAQVEDAGKSLGLWLIPKIEDLIGFGSDTINFFEHNRLAAIGLGLAIGGPLVYSIGVYLAEQAVLMGTRLASFFADAVVGVESLIVGFNTLSVASAGALGPLGLLVAGIIAVGTAGVTHFDDAGKAGQQFAESFVAGLGPVQDKAQAVRDEMQRLGDQVNALKPLMDNAPAGKPFADLANQQEVLFKQYEGLKAILPQVQTAQKATGDATKYAGDAVAGLTEQDKALQAQMKQAATDEAKWSKQWSSDFDTLQKVGGTALASVVSGLDLTLPELDAMTKSAQQVASSMTSSFDSATNVVQGFGNQTKVTGKDIATFFYTQVVAAQNWEHNLQTLMAKGVNVDIVQQFAEAGPKAAVPLQAMVDQVTSHGAGAINAADRAAQAALQTTTTDVAIYSATGGKFYQAGQALIDGMAAGVYERAAGLVNAVTGVTNTALLRAKQANGIASPSRVWAEQVGKPLAEGVVAGFTSHMASTPLTVPFPGRGGSHVGGSPAAGGGTAVINATIATQMTGQDIVRKLRDYARVNGWGWIGP